MPWLASSMPEVLVPSTMAMRAGVNYPQGPLAWADAIGPAYVLRVLHNLQATYGEDRYRPSLLLRRRVAEGRTLHD